MNVAAYQKKNEEARKQKKTDRPISECAHAAILRCCQEQHNKKTLGSGRAESIYDSRGSQQPFRPNATGSGAAPR